MTLILMEGFDHFSTLADKSWGVSGNGGITTGRNGSGGYTGANWTGGSNGAVSKSFPARDEIVFGCAMNWGDLNCIPSWQLREGATVHLECVRNGSGLLEFKRGSGGTILGTSTYVVNASTWFYLEIRIKIHDTAGTIQVKINGTNQFTLTGQDTRNGGTGVLDTIIFLANQVTFASGLHIWTFDDIYICDMNGSVNKDFLGDCKVETLFPNGNGNSSQFVGSDADSTNNYLLVDEAAPNGDTDYVESDVVGQKDTYAYGNMATVAGIVYGVQVLPYAKKNDAGTREIVSVARLSTTEEDSATKPLTTGYVYLPDIRETKPGGGSWSIADVNNAEFGVKVNV